MALALPKDMKSEFRQQQRKFMIFLVFHKGTPLLIYRPNYMRNTLRYQKYSEFKELTPLNTPIAHMPFRFHLTKIPTSLQFLRFPQDPSGKN